MRKLSWIIAGILCTTPAYLQAAELGNAKVESHLTEHLKVLIPLMGLNGSPLDEVKVQLAPENYYRQAGLSLDQLAGNITFQIKSEGKQSFILMGSKRVITDPILSILLEVTSGESKVIKEFDLLLNPPVQGAINKPTENNFNNTLRGSVTAEPSEKTAGWQPVKDVSDVKMGGTYPVKRGDTLYDIAKRAASEGSVSVRPMMQAIINANPDAFVGGNGNEMKSGVTLKVPTSYVAKSTVPTKIAPAATSIAQATASQPKLQLLSAEPGKPAPSIASAMANQAAANTVSGILPAIDNAPVATTNATTNNTPTVQQNNEAMASIDAKSDAMSKQISLLNEQLKQVQGLIANRNQNIELLQQKIKASDEQTQLLKKQLEAQNNDFWIHWAPYLLGGAGLLILILLLVAASRGRGRDKEVNSLSSSYPTQNKSNSEVSLIDASKTFEPVATPLASQMRAATAVALPVFQHESPAFDVKSIIDEARLLLSYNLNEQALEVVHDAIALQPEELALYQELARIYSEDNNIPELNKTLEQIDAKFGSANRPDLLNPTTQASTDSSVSVFDERYSQDSTSADRQLTNLAPDTLDVLSPGMFSLDSGLEIPVDDRPMDLNEPRPAAPESQGSTSVELPHSLDDLDFDLPALDDLGHKSSAASNDLDLELSTFPEAPLPDHSIDLNQVNSGSSFSAEFQNDTRLGLAEAFLGVGDQESYRMIADEIESEGNADLVAELRKIELKFKAD
ncbi:MAG: type IV pilus assembly protein FimV [Halothiobacillus sp.]